MLAGYQNGQPPFQGHRTEQHEQTFGRGADFVQRNNYIQQPAAVPNWKHNISVNVEQAVFNPRGPGRGIPLQTHSPNPAPGRRSNYMNGVGNDHSSNVQGRKFIFQPGLGYYLETNNQRCQCVQYMHVQCHQSLHVSQQ